MTAEGTFPKSDGDVLYASEANVLAGSPQTSENGPYTTTSATYVLLRTYTVGGISGMGFKLATITFDVNAQTTVGQIKIQRNTNVVNPPNALATNQYFIDGATTAHISLSCAVDNGDTINIYGLIASSNTLTVSNVKLFCNNPTITFTGS